jgi:hypothetical protein
MASTELIVGVAILALVLILLLVIFYVAPRIRPGTVHHHHHAPTGATGEHHHHHGPTGPTGPVNVGDVLTVTLATNTGYGNNVLQDESGATGTINVLNAPLSVVMLRQGRQVTVNWPEIDFLVATGVATPLVQTPVNFVPAGWRPLFPAIVQPAIVSPPHAYAFPAQTIHAPLPQIGGETGMDSVGRVRLVSDLAPGSDVGRLQWALDSAALLNWPNDNLTSGIADGALTFITP